VNIQLRFVRSFLLSFTITIAYERGFEACASAAIASADAAAAAAVPSFTPPAHLPSLRSQATVPKLVVRRTFARRADSLSHFLERASILAAEGKVLPTTFDFGFWTWRRDGWLVSVARAAR